MSNKIKLATTWLDGCSGCHMSILDMDERLLLLAQKADIVYSPLVDTKEFPEGVDVAIVEGAVSSEEDLHKIKKIRARSKMLICLGDCGITGNVPSMRNALGPAKILNEVYRDNGSSHPPTAVVPALLPMARPVHEFVKVDFYIPGCPPPADAIFYAISELLEGRTPDLSQMTRFGA